MTSEILTKAAEHWNKVSSTPRPTFARNWWQSPQIWRHINALCGLPGSASQHAGFNRMIAEEAGRALGLGVSVGCGAAIKEIRLILAGVVERFDLFEISEKRIALGVAEAERLGVTEKLNWRREDAFTAHVNGAYDLVHWNNSLHHMLDVDQAVAWSLDCLRPGGIFAMDDFVGPSRFQWTDEDLACAAAFRDALPKRLRANPGREGAFHSIELTRPTIESMIGSDPTEAADSGRIIEVLRKRLPNMPIIPTGGVIYQLGCRDILGNFDEANDDDRALISLGLMLDKRISTLSTTHYAVAVTRIT